MFDFLIGSTIRARVFLLLFVSRGCSMCNLSGTFTSLGFKRKTSTHALFIERSTVIKKKLVIIFNIISQN